MKDAMFFQTGKPWGRSRRIIAPNLTAHNVAGMLPIMSKVTNGFEPSLVRMRKIAYEVLSFGASRGRWPLPIGTCSLVAASAGISIAENNSAGAFVSHASCILLSCSGRHVDKNTVSIANHSPGVAQNLDCSCVPYQHSTLFFG